MNENNTLDYTVNDTHNAANVEKPSFEEITAEGFRPETVNAELGNAEKITAENITAENIYSDTVNVNSAEQKVQEPRQNGVYSNAAFSEVPVPKKKKSGGFFKKALVSISLGVLFGLFAGAGFFAVQRVGDMLMPREVVEEKEEVKDVLAENTVQNPISINTNSITLIETDVTKVAEKVMPAMVSIVNKYTITTSFFGQTFSEEEASSGSGIIVGETDTELLIVSNNHVVADAETLEVTFIDGSVAEAHIKGLDSGMDLAVIAVKLDKISQETMDAITIATLGNSDELKLGEPVVAIGNALGYGQSVTDGIVSALNRELTLEDGSKGKFVQTNAAINPGNSGGALLNMNGEVIGINSNKIGGTAIEGMGYAIPISSANPIIAELMVRQTRSKVAEDEIGYMGIAPQEVTEQISQMFNMPVGIYIQSVEENSAAAKAGLVAGDILTKFDGEMITSYVELQSVLQYYAVGDSAKLTIQRPENGKYAEYEIQITLGERPAAQR